MSVISHVGDFYAFRFYNLYLSVRLLPQRVQHASAYPSSSASHNKFHLLYSLLVSSSKKKSTEGNVMIHSQHSLTGSPTIIYFKLAQFSRSKGQNYADSQGHSQTGSQACRCLEWQEPIRSTIVGGRGCNDFVPVLEGNRTKIAPTEDIFEQSLGHMR